MQKQMQSKKRLLEARANADAILARGANRLLLIEAILIVCVFVALFISLESATALLLTTLTENELLSSLLPAVTSLIYFVLGIFFAAPVVLGLFRLAELSGANIKKFRIFALYEHHTGTYQGAGSGFATRARRISIHRPQRQDYLCRQGEGFA